MSERHHTLTTGAVQKLRETVKTVDGLQVDATLGQEERAIIGSGDDSGDARYCKITTDNDDGTYSVEEWNQGTDAGTGWTKTGIQCWEAKGTNVFDGDGAGVFVTVIYSTPQTQWYISVGIGLWQS